MTVAASVWVILHPAKPTTMTAVRILEFPDGTVRHDTLTDAWDPGALGGGPALVGLFMIPILLAALPILVRNPRLLRFTSLVSGSFLMLFGIGTLGTGGLWFLPGSLLLLTGGDGMKPPAPPNT